MVSIVLISHSSEIADGIKRFVGQMVKDVPIYAVGGTSDGELGTDYERIKLAFEDAAQYDGTLVLFDLGSSFMTAELALIDVLEEVRAKTMIVDAAFVEGAIEAAANASGGDSLDEIVKNLEKMKLGKI